MSTFTRGPVCGVDNCPSRLWRNLDGRRTCQYGHVMVGDVEFDDDGENVGVGTRRIRLTTDSRGNFQSSQLQGSQSQNLRKDHIEVLYGAGARLHFIKCMQMILQKQVDEITTEFPGVPKDAFSEIVKSLWIRYLKTIEDDELTGLTIMTNMCLIYLSLHIMNVPVTSVELNEKIMDLKITYVQATKCIPETWLKKLPNYYMQKLNGAVLWKDMQFFKKLHRFCNKIKFNDFCLERNYSNTFCWNGVMVKYIFNFRLPIELYGVIKNVSGVYSLDEYNYNIKEIGNKNIDSEYLVYFNEVRCICLIVICMKGMFESGKLDNEYIKNWLHLYSKDWDHKNNKLKHDNQLLMKKAFFDTNTLHDDELEDLYLSWVQDTVLPKFDKLSTDSGSMRLDEKIVLRKLYNIIGLVDDKNENANRHGFNTTHHSLVGDYKVLYLKSNLDDSVRDIPQDSDNVISSNELYREFETKIVEVLLIDYNLKLEDFQHCVEKLCRKFK